MEDAAHSVWTRWRAFEGSFVTVAVNSGTLYSGLLSVIDPETGTVVLLSLPGPEVSIVIGHRVTSIEKCDSVDNQSSRVLRDVHEELLSEVALATGIPSDDSIQGDTGDPDKIALALEKMRIPVSREFDESGRCKALSVLNGVARVVEPYRVLDCESTNEIVLKKLRSILGEVLSAG